MYTDISYSACSHKSHTYKYAILPFLFAELLEERARSGSNPRYFLQFLETTQYQFAIADGLCINGEPYFFKR